MSRDSSNDMLIARTFASFLELYCKVGTSELCENPKLLISALDAYVRKFYFKHESFFKEAPTWEKRLHRFMMHVSACMVVYGGDNSEIVGVVGVRLAKFPMM